MADMNPDITPDPASPTKVESAPETSMPASAILEDDDFGDEELGERQADACSMEEGCTVCE